MKKRVAILLVLMAALLITAGSALVLADSPGKITGGFYSREFFDIQQGWFNFSVHEVGPDGEAFGSAKWKEYNEELGWRRVQAHAVCVHFGEYEGNPAATFVIQLDRIRGWQPDGEEVGEYMKFWIVDGGTPGKKGDQWSTLGEWPPTPNIEDYGCWYEGPSPFFGSFEVDGGNLVIHH